MRIECENLRDTAVVDSLERWVAGSSASTPFHRPAWLLAVERGTGQSAFMLVVRDDDGAIAGILPLTALRSRLFGNAMISSGFAVGGGILCDNPETADSLVEALDKLAIEKGCSTAELRGGMLPSNDWQLRSDLYLDFCKALEADDEKQLLAVPKRHRAELRKGLSNDLTFEVGRGEKFRKIHYRLYAENVHRLGTPVFPRRLFEEVLDHFGDDADIPIVSKSGKALSAVLTLYHHQVAMPYWHGASSGARGSHSNEVLYFHLMAHARNLGMTHFDFDRSKAGTGAAAWKKSWGWEGIPLSYAGRAYYGKPLREVNPLSPKYQRKIGLWKKLPLSIANVIGPFLSRGLG